MAQEVWIGLAQVIAKEGCEFLDCGESAYVNVLALASDPDGFLGTLRAAVRDVKCQLGEVQDVERFLARRSTHHVVQELKALADEVLETGEVRFGTFHTYDG